MPAMGIWKDAIQTKLKRKRYEHRDHADVQHYQSKYSRYGSGRPVKKMTGEVAQRNRQKQILLMNYDDDTLNNIQMKANQLRDDPDIDINARVQLWKETINVRRQNIRERPTSEIVEEFPGYADPILIFEEVKMTMGVDLRAVVRQQILILLEKMVTTPAFITDSPPIQLIRAPSTPYPTLVIINDRINVYVDFLPIVSTTSPDDGLALLFAMYSIFELNFSKHSRAIRLLYAVFFGDKRWLSNTIRDVIQEKKINIYMEKNRITSNNTNLISNNSPTNNINSQCSLQDKLNPSCISTIEDKNNSTGDNSNIDTVIIYNE
ncbi:unnamed protein product [Rotaria sordida]|uniref:Uncharacterized protein n=1 Tax=Rotaria sordida TaxID=392033 RepID=A0A815HUA4_9BILA|nr:unnamed protein product [Rotaria sordida]